MVEEIKGFSAKLKIYPFAERRVLHQGQIHSLITGAVENVPASVAERARSRKCKRRGIEPLIRRRVGKLRIANNIRTVIRTKAEDRASRTTVVDIGQQRHGKRTTRLHGNDAVTLPTTQRRRNPTILRQILPAFSERQRVRITHRQPVPHVEVRTSTLRRNVVTILRKIRIASTAEEV